MRRLALVFTVLLVGVSLATAPESREKLRSLTFATLEGGYEPVTSQAKSVFQMQMFGSAAIVLFVVGLWVYFA